MPFLTPEELQLLGAAPAPARPGALRRVADVGVAGLAAVPETVGAVAGLAGMIPGVNIAADPMARGASQFAEDIRQGLTSDARLAQQQANRQRIADAGAGQEGLGQIGSQAREALSVAVDDPQSAFEAAAGSIPFMLGGAGIAKGVQMANAALRPGAAALSRPLAAGIGEGGITAGAVASDIVNRGGPDQQFTDRYAAVPAGVVTGMIPGALSRVPGLRNARDIDEAIAGRIAGLPAREGAGAADSAWRRIPAGIGREALEEGLQSPQEQAFTNIGLGQPWSQDVGSAAVEGAIAGGMFGGAMNLRADKPLPPPVNQNDPIDLTSSGEVQRTRDLTSGVQPDFTTMPVRPKKDRSPATTEFATAAGSTTFNLRDEAAAQAAAQLLPRFNSLNEELAYLEQSLSAGLVDQAIVTQVLSRRDQIIAERSAVIDAIDKARRAKTLAPEDTGGPTQAGFDFDAPAPVREPINQIDSVSIVDAVNPRERVSRYPDLSQFGVAPPESGMAERTGMATPVMLDEQGRPVQEEAVGPDPLELIRLKAQYGAPLTFQERLALDTATMEETGARWDAQQPLIVEQSRSRPVERGVDMEAPIRGAESVTGLRRQQGEMLDTPDRGEVLHNNQYAADLFRLLSVGMQPGAPGEVDQSRQMAVNIGRAALGADSNEFSRFKAALNAGDMREAYNLVNAKKDTAFGGERTASGGYERANEPTMFRRAINTLNDISGKMEKAWSSKSREQAYRHLQDSQALLEQEQQWLNEIRDGRQRLVGERKAKYENVQHLVKMSLDYHKAAFETLQQGGSLAEHEEQRKALAAEFQKMAGWSYNKASKADVAAERKRSADLIGGLFKNIQGAISKLRDAKARLEKEAAALEKEAKKSGDLNRLMNQRDKLKTSKQIAEFLSRRFRRPIEGRDSATGYSGDPEYVAFMRKLIDLPASWPDDIPAPREARAQYAAKMKEVLAAGARIAELEGAQQSASEQAQTPVEQLEMFGDAAEAPAQAAGKRARASNRVKRFAYKWFRVGYLSKEDYERVVAETDKEGAKVGAKTLHGMIVPTEETESMAASRAEAVFGIQGDEDIALSPAGRKLQIKRRAEMEALEKRRAEEAAEIDRIAQGEEEAAREAGRLEDIKVATTVQDVDDLIDDLTLQVEKSKLALSNEYDQRVGIDAAYKRILSDIEVALARLFDVIYYTDADKGAPVASRAAVAKAKKFIDNLPDSIMPAVVEAAKTRGKNMVKGASPFVEQYNDAALGAFMARLEDINGSTAAQDSLAIDSPYEELDKVRKRLGISFRDRNDLYRSIISDWNVLLLGEGVRKSGEGIIAPEKVDVPYEVLVNNFTSKYSPQIRDILLYGVNTNIARTIRSTVNKGAGRLTANEAAAAASDSQRAMSNRLKEANRLAAKLIETALDEPVIATLRDLQVAKKRQRINELLDKLLPVYNAGTKLPAAKAGFITAIADNFRQQFKLPGATKAQQNEMDELVTLLRDSGDLAGIKDTFKEVRAAARRTRGKDTEGPTVRQVEDELALVYDVEANPDAEVVRAKKEKAAEAAVRAVGKVEETARGILSDGITVTGKLKSLTNSDGTVTWSLDGMKSGKEVRRSITMKGVTPDPATFTEDVLGLPHAGKPEKGARAAHKLVKGATTGREVLERVIASREAPALYRLLARKLLATDAATATFRAVENQFRDKGLYNADDHSITLYTNGGLHTIMHELTHAAVVRKMDGKSGPLVDLYNEVANAAHQQGLSFYGVKNVDEFVAEAFTNPEFQKFLASISTQGAPVATKSVWKLFIAAVKRFLGLTTVPNSALERVISLTGGVLEAPTNVRTEGTFAMQASAALDSSYQGIADTVRDWRKKGYFSLAFFHDLVEMAKDMLPAVTKLDEALNEAKTTKRKIELEVEGIVSKFSKLSAARQKVVNSFIEDSTIDQMWGYQPTWKTDVRVDTKMAARWATMDKTEREVIDDVFAHGEKVKNRQIDMMKAGNRTEIANYMGKLSGPYAPLKRHGNYMVVAKSAEYVHATKTDPNDKMKAALESNEEHYIVESYESIAAAKARARELKAAGKYAEVDAFEKDKEFREANYIPAHIIQNMLATAKVTSIKDEKVKESVTKMLQDMYLNSLSEYSARNSARVRRRISGYDKDMMRSFLTQGRADAAFSSVIEHGQKIKDLMNEIQSQKTSGDVGTREDRARLYNKIVEHYVDSLKFNDTPWSDKAMAATSFMQLLSNPSYYVTNLTQPVMVTLPVLAGRHGYFKAWKALIDGYQQIGKVLKGNAFAPNLVFEQLAKEDPNLVKALERAQMLGVLDIGIDSEMGQFEHASNPVSRTLATVTWKLRQVARSVEIINRISSGVAAYKLEMERLEGTDLTAEARQLQAANEAVSVLRRTQGDYSSEAAPLIIKKLPKVITQYRKYQLMQLMLVTRLAGQAFKGATPEEKAQARAQLGFIFAHAGAFAGAIGLPMYNVLAFLFAGRDDDDDDLEVWMREGIPEDLRLLLTRGVPAYMGLDVSQRIGWGNAFSVLPYADLDISRKGIKDLAFGLTGPIGGLAAGFADGVDKMSKGDVREGMALMMPKLLGNAMKAYNLKNEGIRLSNDDLIVSPEDITFADATAVALGLPTTKITEAQWLKQKRAEVEQGIQDEERNIRKQYVKAYRRGDAEGVDDAKAEYREIQDRKRALHGSKVLPFDKRELRPQTVSSLLKARAAKKKREANLDEIYGE